MYVGQDLNLESWYTCIALHRALTHVFLLSRTSKRSYFYCVCILESNYGYQIKLHFHVLTLLRSVTLDTALSQSRHEQFETDTDRISELSSQVQHCRLSDNQYSGNIIATLHTMNVTLCFWSLYIYMYIHIYIRTFIHISIHTYIHIKAEFRKWVKTPRKDVPAKTVENTNLKERISDVCNFILFTGFWENIFTETFSKQ
jgi:hypothetical protein